MGLPDFREYLLLQQKGTAPPINSALLTAWQDAQDANIARSVELAKQGKKDTPEYHALGREYAGRANMIQIGIDAFKRQPNPQQGGMGGQGGSTMQKAQAGFQGATMPPVRVTPRPRQDMVPFLTIPKVDPDDALNTPRSNQRWYADLWNAQQARKR